MDRDGWPARGRVAPALVEWALPPEVLAFATVRREDGCAIGRTAYLEIHPEHARLEIGGTWLAADAWGTGANAEAKLLLLQHAFGLGYQRVEFKTDARNVRARRALEALPAEFEASSASTCSSAAGSVATGRTTA